MLRRLKPNLLNLLLILTSLVAYLEWGGGNRMFLLSGEIAIVKKFFTDPEAALHPFVLIPLAGQAVLLVSIFQNPPNKLLTFIGMASIGLLLLFIFLIGLIGFNYKILLSTLPFILTAMYTIAHYRNRRSV